MTKEILKQNTVKTNNENLTLLVLALFFVQHLTGNRMFAFAGVAVLGAMLFFLDTDAQYYAYALLLPNTHILKFVGNNAALVGYWLLLVVVKIVLSHLRGLPFDRWMMVHLLVHIVAMLICMSVTANFGQANALVRFLSTIVMINYMARQPKFDKDRLLRQYILGILLNVFLGAVYHFSQGISIMNMHFAGIGNDRNYFAVSLAFSVNVLLVYAYLQRKLTVTNIFQVFVIVGGIILSGSRTALLIVLPAMITMITLLLRDRSSVVQRCLVFIMLGVGVFLFGRLLADSIQVILARFSNLSMSGANGRIEAWRLYLRYSFSSVRNLLFGVGDSLKLIEMGIAEVAEHNTWVEMLFTIGLLGTFTLLPLYVDIYLLFRNKKRKKGIVVYFPLLCILAGYSTINGLYSENLTFAIVLACIVIGMENKRGTAARNIPEILSEQRTEEKAGI